MSTETVSPSDVCTAACTLSHSDTAFNWVGTTFAKQENQFFIHVFSKLQSHSCGQSVNLFLHVGVTVGNVVVLDSAEVKHGSLHLPAVRFDLRKLHFASSMLASPLRIVMCCRMAKDAASAGGSASGFILIRLSALLHM